MTGMELSRSDTTGIKGIAILFMLWHHLFLNVTEYGPFTHSLAVFFKVCVALFLFVSGYGVAKQYGVLNQRNIQNTIKFLLRRFINFFLPYWFCFLLVVVIGHLCGYTFQDAYPTTRDTFKCIFLDVFGQMGYNSYLHPWWFNKMIIQLYLVFPILFLSLTNKYSAISGLIAIIVIQLFAKRIPGNLFFVVEGGLPAFYIGMISARFSAIPLVHPKKRVIFVSLFFVLIIGLGVLNHTLTTIAPYPAIIIRALIALCIVFIFKSCEGGRSSVFGFVGKYSTIMYLTHVLIIILIPGIVYYPRHSLGVFLLFVIGCLTMAMIIRWLEKVSHFDNLRLSLANHFNSL